jgi:hypothetical protein
MEPVARLEQDEPSGELQLKPGSLVPLLRLNRNFFLTPVGLHIVGQPSYRAWNAAGIKLARMRTSVQWSIGDWLLYGEGRGDWGETYAQAMDFTQYSEQTLQNFVWVCGRWHFSRRKEISFTHHAVIAALHPAVQDRFIQLAIERGWSSRELDHECDPFRDKPKYAAKPEPPEPTPAPVTVSAWLHEHVEGPAEEVKANIDKQLARFSAGDVVHVEYWLVTAAEPLGELP